MFAMCIRCDEAVHRSPRPSKISVRGRAYTSKNTTVDSRAREANLGEIEVCASTGGRDEREAGETRRSRRLVYNSESRSSWPNSEVHRASRELVRHVYLEATIQPKSATRRSLKQCTGAYKQADETRIPSFDLTVLWHYGTSTRRSESSGVPSRKSGEKFAYE